MDENNPLYQLSYAHSYARNHSAQKLTGTRLRDFRLELDRRGYNPMEVKLLQKTRRRLLNRWTAASPCPGRRVH